MVSTFDFDGYRSYVLENEQISMKLTEFGASILSLRFLGKELCLSYDCTEKYLESGGCVGAIVGRYANRIGGGSFELGGVKYELDKNNGENTLHGGSDKLPLHKRGWKSEVLGDDAIRFTIQSPDGDNGFPGNVDISVTYTISGSSLRLDFEAVSDKLTVMGPTTHAYFDLTGEGDCLKTLAKINADSYIPVNDKLIPTGEVLPAAGDFDFHALRPIGGSFDNCFVLKGTDAAVFEGGGTRMSMETDYPGIQLYTGDFLDCGIKPRTGFAMEPEFFPDSPNRPEFPFEPLKAGEKFTKYIVYRFEQI